MSEKIQKPDSEWKKQLTPNQYYVTRQKGTEPPFTGEYESTETPGTYKCVCCGTPLFRSETKFPGPKNLKSNRAAASALALVFVLIQGKRERVDAVAQTCRAGTIVKDVTEMRIAAAALYFRADHAVRPVGFLVDSLIFERRRKAGPAAAGMKFRLRAE